MLSKNPADIKEQTIRRVDKTQITDWYDNYQSTDLNWGGANKEGVN